MGRSVAPRTPRGSVESAVTSEAGAGCHSCKMDIERFDSTFSPWARHIDHSGSASVSAQPGAASGNREVSTAITAHDGLRFDQFRTERAFTKSLLNLTSLVSRVHHDGVNQGDREQEEPVDPPGRKAPALVSSNERGDKRRQRDNEQKNNLHGCSEPYLRRDGVFSEASWTIAQNQHLRHDGRGLRQQVRFCRFWTMTQQMPYTPRREKGVCTPTECLGDHDASTVGGAAVSEFLTRPVVSIYCPSVAPAPARSRPAPFTGGRAFFLPPQQEERSRWQRGSESTHGRKRTSPTIC